MPRPKGSKNKPKVGIAKKALRKTPAKIVKRRARKVSNDSSTAIVAVDVVAALGTMNALTDRILNLLDRVITILEKCGNSGLCSKALQTYTGNGKESLPRDLQEISDDDDIFDNSID